jgi:protein-disulfide isomerase
MRSRRGIRIQIAVTAALVAAIAAVGVVQAVRYQGLDRVGTAAVDTVRVGDPHAPALISATEDLQCPYCRKFEAAAGAAVDELVASGQVRVEYHIIAFLDKMSTTNYSSRAANASACVAATDVAKWPHWHTLMFQRQPKEESAGLNGDQLVAIARDAGLTGPAVADCITSGRYLTPVAAATKNAWAHGLKQTPTVLVNGSLVAPGADRLPSTADVRAAVDTALRTSPRR